MQTPSPPGIRADTAPRRRRGDRFQADASGEAALEYGLIASLIVLVLIAALPAFQTASNGLYNRISNAMVNSGR